MAATFLITGASGLVGFRVLVLALDAGHKVRYTVRSEEKAQVVRQNPAVQKLAPGDRLSSVLIPDFTAAGAFDSALDGVTHIVHAGAPTPLPHLSAATDIFQPTLKITSELLRSALKTPSVERVVITSSIVANLGLAPAPGARFSASTRQPLPDPLPETFDEQYPAYVAAKIVDLHEAGRFAAAHGAHFAVSHVMPGYVFGRNELARDADMMQAQNSSNNFLMMAMLGREPYFGVLDAFCHIDDVAELHLRVALEDGCGGRDYGLAIKVDYATIFDIVKKAFPKAAESGVFKRGKVPVIPIEYDSSDAEAVLGGKLRSFETAVVDVASQYLEVLGKEKA